MSKKKNTRKKGMLSVNATVAENRKARHDYEIEEVFEAGLVLTGTEVKSLRLGQCSLTESHAGEKNGAIYLLNAHIPEYLTVGKHLQHDVRRPRKLLIKKREQNKLLGAVNRDGYTLIPLKIYFNDRGLAKLSLALAKGKKQHDKREATKERDWNRQKQRLLREKG